MYQNKLILPDVAPPRERDREKEEERGTQASNSSVYSCPEDGGEAEEAEEAGAAEDSDSDSDSGMYKYLHHVPSSECQCKYFQTLMK